MAIKKRMTFVSTKKSFLFLVKDTVSKKKHTKNTLKTVSIVTLYSYCRLDMRIRLII